MGTDEGQARVEFYNPTYGSFAQQAYEEIRREVYGEDIGQNSWLTGDEHRRFLSLLNLTSESKVLEVACGTGGPALFVAEEVGCHVTGLDINEEGIARAMEMARARRLDGQVEFRCVDAGKPLAFGADAFDAVVCIDSINHLPDRLGALRDWKRVLKPGGRILFTDPIIVTGLLSHEEIAARSSIGYFLFAPLGEDERLLEEAGLELLGREDVTDNMEAISKRWAEARAARRDELIAAEGESTYEGQQQFLSTTHLLARERRLSRLMFVARKLAV